MLSNIYIQNYALIDELSADFCGQLNIITGETGSGKSILLGALGLILGDRADASVLQDKTKKCVVEAKFQLEEGKFLPFFEANELDFDTQLIIRREINPQGKSRAFIQDTPVNLQVLRSLTSMLVDLHLQNETQELNGPAFHLNVVDVMAGNAELLNAFRKIYKSLKETEKYRDELKETLQRALLEKDYKQFLLEELQQAALETTDPLVLEQEAEILEHAGSIAEGAMQAMQLLGDADVNILDQLAALKNIYIQSGKHFPAFAELLTRVDSVIIELKDIYAETGSQAASIAPDPRRLDEINRRMQELYLLAQKHRAKDPAELKNIRDQLEQEVSEMQTADEALHAAEQKYIQLLEEAGALAQQLSEKRKSSFLMVEQGIHALLPEAGLPKSKIKIDCRPKPLQADGTDDIQFLFSANTGSEFIPLHKTASGGELSRFMLAIKTYIAGKTALPTLVFDEIDTGVSGETALKMGALMKTLSRRHQLITVTHLPQIAAKADRHFKLYKEERDGKTFSRIRVLKQDEVVQELAEMLGGSAFTQKTKEAAAELLKS